MMDTATAAGAVAGRMQGANVRFARVATDTRTLAPGDLFVAIKGERFDGHDFVGVAFERGAAAALVAADRAGALAGNLIAVPDSLAALGALARHWRARFAVPVIVVVGSNGKTTVKEMLAAILRAHYGDAHVLATEGNLNNAIGLPLTLLRLRAGHEAAAIELGMNHPGETAELAAIAQPTVAVVNNAQREHQEFMRSVADVAAEHAALVRALAAGGTAVLNADDPSVDVWRVAARERPGVRVIDFALDHPAAIHARGDSRAHRRPDGVRHARGRRDGAARGAGSPQRVECARRGRGGARDRHSAFRRRPRPRGLSSRRGPPRRAALRRGRRRDRRQLQREPGFGARRDRRARRGALAALAGARRHGRSRRERPGLPPRGRSVRARRRHRPAADGRRTSRRRVRRRSARARSTSRRWTRSPRTSPRPHGPARRCSSRARGSCGWSGWSPRCAARRRKGRTDAALADGDARQGCPRLQRVRLPHAARGAGVHDRAPHLVRRRPQGHRVAHPDEDRPGDPRRRAADASREGRHADDGGRADPRFDHGDHAAVGRSRESLRVGDAARDGGLRRDRLGRRLPEGRPQQSEGHLRRGRNSSGNR